MRAALPCISALLLLSACSSGSSSSPAGSAEPGRYLEAVRARGQLRFIVRGAPDAGSSQATSQQGVEDQDRVLARTVAASLGVGPRFVRLGPQEDPVAALAAGRGEVILERLPFDAAVQRGEVELTRPVRIVSEVLVGQAGRRLPAHADALDGLPIRVRAGSRHHASLLAIAQSGPTLRIETDARDVEAIARDVAAGELPLTVVDSDRLHQLRRSIPDLEPAFELTPPRAVAWAMPGGASELRAAIDEVLARQGVLARPIELATQDLDGISSRDTLRVLTLNHEVSYFVHRGVAYGFDYEMAHELARNMGVRLELVVPPRRDLLIPWLLEGRGDLIAASFTRTSTRAERVSFSRPYLRTREMVVAHATETDVPVDPEDLAGRQIHVSRSSSYYQSLISLGSRYGPFEVVPTPEELDTSSVLEQVAAGSIGLTVADAHILAVKASYQPDVRGLFPLPDPVTGEPATKSIAFAVRPSNPRLLARVNQWLASDRGAQITRVLRARYLRNADKNRQRSLEWARSSGQISRYDRLIIEAARRHGIDWRLMAAQAFVESRFDPEAKSWAGAVGLFQILPSTARALGYGDITDPAVSADAAAHYLDRLIQRFDEPQLPYRVRVQFALAAYNVGYGHVLDARRLARRRGLDPDRWFGHVEEAMLLLAKPKFARLARHGFCRGGEPVRYVRKIQALYEAYTDIAQG